MPSAIPNLFNVAGKVVVISGGGTGIGRFLAEGFVENGAKAIILGRRGDVLDHAAEEINAEYGGSGGGQALAVQGDVSTKAGVEGIVAAISAREERVDVVINNAAVQKPWKHAITDHLDPDAVEKLVWEGVDDEDWDVTNRINVNGVYFLTAGLVPLLRKSADPSVIVISSIAAIANQRPVSTMTYGVSKAAALHLGKMLAGRLAPLHIRVNTILPGTFPTEITSRPAPTASDPKARQLLPPVQVVANRTPLGRVGTKDEILGPCHMLASPAGAYMTGAVISVDGGRNLNAGIDDGIKLPDDCYH